MRHYLAVCCLPLLLTGCTLTSTAPATAASGPAIRGTVHGGQQPVSGAYVYLYAANTAGYNTTGPTYSSVSLLNSSVLTNNPSKSGVDANGNYYVITDNNGSFTISGDYSCTPDSNGIPGQQVYLYAVGGNAGAGTNTAAGLMAIAGDCPAAGNFASTTPTVTVNEVTTIAAAYAMAGFAYDATHVSSSGTTLARTGVKNAFANASNLANLATGTAYATTPVGNGGNGTVPQATIYTLANILAACVNSNGAITGPTNPSNCYTLLYNAESSGSSGTVPADTATAAINIAHNPGSNITNLFGLTSSTPPFGSALTSKPNDFTIGINFTGGGLEGGPFSLVAIDASGNAWITNSGASSVTKLSNLGAALSGSGGISGGGLAYPAGIAIDLTGNAWVANFNYPNGSGVTVISSSGSVISGSPITGGCLSSPQGIAIDAADNVFVSNDTGNCITKISHSGSILSGSNGYTGNGLDGPRVIAIDGAGNVWVGNDYGGAVSKFSNSGNSLSGTTGFVTGGTYSSGIAIDSSGDTWVTNQCTLSSSCGPPNLIELSNSGAILSGANGYSGGDITNEESSADLTLDGSGNVWITNQMNSTHAVGIGVSEFSSSGVVLSGSTYFEGGNMNQPGGVAVDGSGDVWIPNQLSNTVTELIGAATPVITPIAAGLPSTPTSDGSSNLGTRP